MKFLLLMILVVSLVGCGGSDEASTAETETSTTTEQSSTTEATTTVEATDPLSCLEDAGLSSVEQRDSDFWRGYHDSPFYQVGVALLPSRAEARGLVNDAVDVYAAQAGKYVVTGPAKPSAGGQVTADEGTEASGLVQEVASCLGG